MAARLRKVLAPLSDYVEIAKREGAEPNEKGLKVHIASLTKQKLADMGITDTQDLFISPRDGQPFVINYGIPTTGGSAPAVWEQTGVDGRRFIIYLDDKVEEIDAETFRKLGLKK